MIETQTCLIKGTDINVDEKILQVISIGAKPREGLF